MKLVSNLTNPNLWFHCNLLLMPNRAFPVQPTANLKEAIECWSCSYGKLPPAAGALDTT